MALVRSVRAASPFDNQHEAGPICNADAILRTSDNVDFYVHKVILSLASSFFAGLFSIAKPLGGQDATTVDDLPVIAFDEDSVTLDYVLRYCYPVRDPSLSDLIVVNRVLGAAIKYALDEATISIREVLQKLIPSDPLEAFAVSVRHHLTEEAKSAAMAWKGTRTEWQSTGVTFADTASAQCYAPCLENLPATAFYRIVNSQRDTGYFTAIIEIQITSNPIYPLQSVLLPHDATSLVVDGKPVIQACETSSVLGQLLRLCYPPRLTDSASYMTGAAWSTRATVSAIEAALLYGMHAVADAYRSHLQQSIPSDPFSVYAIALVLGWYDEAHESAIFMARHVIVPRLRSTWMDMISTKEYILLLEFWYACQDAIFTTVEDTIPDADLPSQQWKQEWQRCSPRNGRRQRTVLMPLVEHEVHMAQPQASLELARICERSEDLESRIDKRLREVRLCVR